MKREICTPRPGWEKIVEEHGLTFHQKIMPGYKYWDEGACYHLTAAEVDMLEKAANDLNELCLKAGEEIIKHEWWNRLRLDDRSVQLIKSSWHAWQQHLYGRFDFVYDGKNPPKMLEYNADTPTSLLESAVVQWFWMEQVKGTDQFNSLHERLIERWKELKIPPGSKVYMTCPEQYEEDRITAEYLADTCRQAGFDAEFIDILQIGWNPRAQSFRDLQEQDIRYIFKLYPWEWLMADKFSHHLRHDRVTVFEPAWKMMWSNKGILPILWEIAPNHPNLLPAFETEEAMKGRPFIKKPIYGREGANVSIRADGISYDGNGEYGDEGYIYQEFHQAEFDGFKPVLGLWMVGDYCCGMGIRESDGWVTNNFSRFVPHHFTP